MCAYCAEKKKESITVQPPVTGRIELERLV